MKELPTQLHNAMIDGLTMLLTLRLSGSPAADTADDGNGKSSRPLRRLNVEHYGRASHEHQMPELRGGA